MDILGGIRSAPVVDLAILAGLFAAFIAGAMQGAIRRILGIVVDRVRVPCRREPARAGRGLPGRQLAAVPPATPG